MKLRVVQPAYFAGEDPDEKIAAFLMAELDKTEPGELVLLPEYSNAGGLSDSAAEMNALPRAEIMLEKAAAVAREKGAYVAVNVLQRRFGKLKNSTYLFDTTGQNAFVYDKIHLPPSEVKLGVERGDGACFAELDGIRFGFLTCYDVYFNEQIEYLAKQKPDILLIPGYQRGERVDVIEAQAKLAAFRCNAFVARASYSMNDDQRGGCSMLVAPDGKILQNLGKQVGSVFAEISPGEKYLRPAGFGEGLVRNDAFIDDGMCPWIFENK